MRIKGQISAADFVEQAKQKGAGPHMVGRSNAVRTTTENGTFDSKYEAGKIGQLFEMQMRGLICNLETQRPFDLCFNGVIIGRYRADAVFVARQEITLQTLDGPRVFGPGERVTVDAKGHKTEVYKIKRNLMKAIHGIEIVEI